MGITVSLILDKSIRRSSEGNFPNRKWTQCFLQKSWLC